MLQAVHDKYFSLHPRYEETEETDAQELKKEEKLEVAKEDMEGFAIGGGIGIALGGIIGSVGGVPLAAIGAGAGALIGGIPYAVVWSIVAAKEKKENPNENISSLDDIIKIRHDFSMIDYRCKEPLFSENIIGANVGFLHNYILSSLYHRNKDTFWDWSNEQIIDSTFVVLAEYYNSIQISDLSHLISNDLYYSNEYIPLHNYVELYFEYLNDVSESNWINFSEDFMNVINTQLSDENEIMLINGSISTFIYSYHLWNFNLPDIYVSDYICYRNNGNFCHIRFNDSFRYNLECHIYSNNCKLHFIPVIKDSVISSLYIFDEISPIYYSLSYLPYIYKIDSTYYLTNDNYNIFVFDNNNQFYFPIGIYELKRFGGGYIIFPN